MPKIVLKYNIKIHLAIIFFLILILAEILNSSGIAANKSHSWTVVKTLHFDIYYPDELSDMAVYTAKIAEESYVYLAYYLQHELTIAVPVIIHPRNAAEEINNFYKINISYTGSYLTYHKKLTRKLANIFQHNILYDAAPGWEIPGYGRLADSQDIFMDSMAYYLSAGFDKNADMIMRDIVSSKNYSSYFNIRTLKNYRKDITSEIGRSFFFFLEKEYGQEIIAELLLNIRDYDSLYKAIEITTEKAIKDVNANWAAFYLQRYANTIGETAKTNEIALPYQKGLHIPSFTVDGKTAVFVKQRKQGGANIVLYDVSSRNISKKIEFPFNNITDASISPDGKSVVFVGQSNSSADVYIYNIQQKNLSRITDDYFIKRFPKISPDNSYIVFSSNENKENYLESENFKLIKIDLKSKTKFVLIDNNAENIHPNISPDNKKVLYVSSVSGIYNVYYYDMNTGKNTQVTDAQNGAFFPCWFIDGKNIAYSAYHDNKYKIIVKDASIPEAIKEKKTKPEYKAIIYPTPYFDLKDLALSEYSDERNVNISTRGSGLAWNDGFAGNIKIKAADILNEHKLSFNSDFLNYNKDKDLNYNLDYEYKKYRTEFGIGAFYKTNPLQQDFYDGYWNALSFYPDNINAKNYGFYAHINYPLDDSFIKNCSLKIKGSSIAYEDLNLYYNNLYLKELSLSFNYDNIIFDKVWPVSGSRFNLEYSYDFTEANRGVSFCKAALNFLQLFRYDKLLVFSIKGSGAKIFGKDDDYFKYHLGGFNSIRGHELFAYRGQNIFLANLETRIIIIDKFTLSWPAAIVFNDISLVLFADCGSAWDKDYRFRNTETGKFRDFKTAFGTGLRFLLQNHIVFKLDAAWPYYYKSFGKREIISGFELRY